MESPQAAATARRPRNTRPRRWLARRLISLAHRARTISDRLAVGALHLRGSALIAGADGPTAPTPPAPTPPAPTPPAPTPPAPTPPAPTPPNPPSPPAPPAPSYPEGMGDAGKRALDAERARAKAAEDRAKAAEARAQQYEDRDKTDLQKAQDEAAREKQRADEATAKVLRRDVAAGMRNGQVDPTKVLPVALADTLQGATEEELVRHADVLLQHIAAPATPPPNFNGGPQPPTPAGDLDRQIAEAQAKGDWTLVNTLNAQKLAQSWPGAATTKE